MNSSLLNSLFLVLLLLSISCKESQPTETQKPGLTTQTPQIIVAKNYDRYITVIGGEGQLHVKNMTDTSIARVTFNYIEYVDGTAIRSIRITGTELGYTMITLQDSSRKAEVTITVTVSAMALNTETVTIEERQNYYLQIYGGKPPYSVIENTNPSIASASITALTIGGEGFTPGNTVVKIKDSDPMGNSATLYISVTPKPVFTTPGTVSFSSNIGAFSVNGIVVEYIADAPSNAEGAGGIMQGYGKQYIECEFIAYKKKSTNIVDFMAIHFHKTGIGIGTLPVSTRSGRIDSAYIWFVFNGDLNSPTADIQKFSTGALTITAFNEKEISGTFQGSGQLVKDLVPVTGQNFSVADGSFRMPILLEDFVPSAGNTDERKRVEAFVKRVLKNQQTEHWRNSLEE